MWGRPRNSSFCTPTKAEVEVQVELGMEVAAVPCNRRREARATFGDIILLTYIQSMTSHAPRLFPQIVCRASLSHSY